MDSQQSSNKNPPNIGEIEERIEKLQNSNPQLKQNFGMLDSNVRKLSSNSKNGLHEVSKKQENHTEINGNFCKEGNKNSNFASKLPTMESLGVAQPDSNIPDQSLQDSLAQYLVLSSQSQNPLRNIISPEAQLIVETHFFKDLFLSAFKRLLQSSKPTILSNLSKSVGITNNFTPVVPNSCLRSSPNGKRKNTDPLSFDTYESDKNQHFFNPQTPNFPQMGQRHQMSLSSFTQTGLKGDRAMGIPPQQKDSDSWDPKEEKKQ